MVNQQKMSAEMLAHYSRYLCVLLSGFAEQSVKELASYYCKQRASSPVHRYVSMQLALIRNIDLDKLRRLVESFNTEWWRLLEEELEDELQAFVSVATTRNNISHGGDSGITLIVVRQYFEQVSRVLVRLSDLFDPSGSSETAQNKAGVACGNNRDKHGLY
jgi:HEPN superfamily RiboL-PSP-like protein